MVSSPSEPEDRDRVLAAAAALLREGRGLSVAEVAARVGLSRAAVYRLVGGREALLEALQKAGQVGEADAARAGARGRILDALEERLKMKTLGHITVEEVATTAGLSVMTLYRHFGDRHGLCRAFLEERSPRGGVRALLGRVGEDDDLEAVLVQFAQAFLTFVHRYPHMVRMLFTPDSEEAALIQSMQEGTTRTRDVLAGYLATQMRRGRLREGDPGQLVQMLLGMALGLGVPGVGVADVEASARLLVGTFLHGQAVKAGPGLRGQAVKAGPGLRGQAAKAGFRRRKS
ncbi:helix-turn-helix domain-containing protein [Chondromyces apiculatus]|uniref:HTH tetR-type domain-containing protein n=1 Tax=Chondromyces apiculatus DSM 436 TaxID=1192034 RepID=A0A017TA28_9BACT|nr:helix-turn-helix domain-containing protein [Chondromyces apiculatus]EYF05792.1 Hypothetical protein CAP_2793 [Chondromyces apiculatus DSM 436]